MTPATAFDVAELKATALPKLFADVSQIGQYGSDQKEGASLDDFSDLMETGAVGALAERISSIVSKLSDADPKQLTRKVTWLDKFLGSGLERSVRYRQARKSLEDLLEEAQGYAQRVRDTVAALNKMIESHAGEAERLRAYIRAGREYLDENPDAGAIPSGSLEFDRPRERLARKLANLSTLLASHEMSVTQMKLTKAQAVDMLDRFGETVTVLVPVWRQHTLALITTKNMSPVMVAEATKAHQALMRSLSQSLEGIE